MKKGLILCLALVMALAVVANAVPDSYRRPLHTKHAGTKAVGYIDNVYVFSSADRGATYSAPMNITNFNYPVDGKWIIDSPSQIVFNNVGGPAISFCGGNDVNGFSHTWFYSEATGLVVVDSSLYLHAWASIAKADGGDLYVSWGDYFYGGYPGWENTTAGDIFIARSTDNGFTWGPKVNVSTYLEAINPNDSCQAFPKLASRAISGVHLEWYDDSPVPGSFVQGVGPDSLLGYVRYAKVNLDLSGLDAAVGIQTMGVTAYDWATTGSTQGLAIDNIEQVACTWTYGPAGDCLGDERNIGYNYYVPGVGAGIPIINLTELRSGYNGISVSSLSGAVAVTYHETRNNKLSGYCQIDEGGIGANAWGDEFLGTKTGYAWPSVAFISRDVSGGESPAESLAFSGVENVAGMTAAYTFLELDEITNSWTSSPDYSGTLYSYSAIGANDQGIYGAFTADILYSVPPVAPTLNLTVGVPTADSINLWWLRSTTNETVDTFLLLRKMGDAGSWSVFATIDTVAWKGKDTVNIYDGWLLPRTPADTFYYALLANDEYDGNSDTSNIESVVVGTSITAFTGITGAPITVNVGKFSLNQSRPNPVNKLAELSFTLPRSGNYSLKIYNIAGQVIRVLDSKGNAGLNKVSWNGLDNNGRMVANGVYLYNLQAFGNSATKKLIVVR